jgi:hypothetical protein
MTTPSVRLQTAERYRRMARTITDRRTVDALNELAAKYEAQAAAMQAAADSPDSPRPGQPKTEGRD